MLLHGEPHNWCVRDAGHGNDTPLAKAKRQTERSDVEPYSPWLSPFYGQITLTMLERSSLERTPLRASVVTKR